MTRTLTVAIVLTGLAGLLGVGCSTSGAPEEVAQGSSVRTKSQAARRLERPANTKRLKPQELVDRLVSAGLASKDIGPPQMSMDDVSRFPEEARSTMRLRVSDGQGNSAPLTFVEFSSWKAAAKLHTKPVNGFAVRNWFVLGTVNNYFVELVSEALAG